jgi:TonB family protein
MKKTLLLIIAILPFYAVADFFTAINDYENKKYEPAYSRFLQMAKMGETRSQFNLGVMYYNGEFVEKDINKAYAWLKLATNNDTATDQEKQVFQQIEDKVTQKDAAQDAFLQIESYSNKNLLVELYPEFLNTDESNPDRATPLKIVQPKYPRYAALNGIQGWVKFRFDLDKLGLPRNIMLLEAVPEKVFERASFKVLHKWRFSPSVDNKGQAIETKNVVYTMSYRLKGADPMEIKKQALKKAEKGLLNNNAHAQYQLAIWSKYGLLKDKKKYNSNKLFLSSAIQGHPLSQYEVGRSLVFGKGCKQDKEKGLSWLNRAASSGSPDARELLANVLMANEDLASQIQAVKFYQAITKKSARTSINLARLLTDSKYQEILNPKEAIDIIDDVNDRQFNDDITINEIKAKAYFNLGKIKKAISYQEDAVEEAEDTGADTTKAKETLDKYVAVKNAI